jgi:dTDP-4-amino-4,6-dideoxygalactose transaminase
MNAHSLNVVPSQPVPMLDVNRQNRPLQTEIDAAIAEVCSSGAFVHGPACHRLEEAIAEYCGTEHAIGCASGSDALLLALMALEIGPGDEVILPSFTFFATAGAVCRLGAKPVFADIVPETFNIDPVDIERKITTATKAILPVHLFGQCTDMDAIEAIASEAGDIPIIEDAAQAIGSQYHGRRAGNLGTLGCFSFYPTKNLGGFGDGGMITSNNAVLATKLRTLRDHGQQPRYHHRMVGVNSRLDALQAAVLNVKLTRIEDWGADRRHHAEHYQADFTRLGLDAQIVPPQVAQGCLSVWNQYTIRVPAGYRDQLQKWLADQKIGSAIYYPIGLHLQDCFESLGHKRGDLPHTEQAAEEVLSLPVFPELTSAERTRVVEAVAAFYGVDAQEGGSDRELVGDKRLTIRRSA